MSQQQKMFVLIGETDGRRADVLKVVSDEREASSWVRNMNTYLKLISSESACPSLKYLAWRRIKTHGTRLYFEDVSHISTISNSGKRVIPLGLKRRRSDYNHYRYQAVS